MNPALQPSRRQLLARLGTGSLAAGLSGCLGGWGGNYVAVVFQNNHDVDHRFAVTVTERSTTVFENEAVVPTGSSKTYPEGINTGDATFQMEVDATIDGDQSVHVVLDRLSEELSIAVTRDGELFVSTNPR